MIILNTPCLNGVSRFSYWIEITSLACFWSVCQSDHLLYSLTYLAQPFISIYYLSGLMWGSLIHPLPRWMVCYPVYLHWYNTATTELFLLGVRITYQHMFLWRETHRDRIIVSQAIHIWSFIIKYYSNLLYYVDFH